MTTKQRLVIILIIAFFAVWGCIGGFFGGMSYAKFCDVMSEAAFNEILKPSICIFW